MIYQIPHRVQRYKSHGSIFSIIKDCPTKILKFSNDCKTVAGITDLIIK